VSGARRPTLGFGFDPGESPYHFVVIVPRPLTPPVTFEERFAWEDDAPGAGEFRPPAQKAALPRPVWDQIAPAVRTNFRERLQRAGSRSAEWRVGENLLAPYLGKELVLLAWAVERTTDEAVISHMLANWLGLMPEERWWLYATVNASFDDPRHGPDHGWRGAIKQAFAENPITAAPPAPPEPRKRAARPTREPPTPAPQLALFESSAQGYEGRPPPPAPPSCNGGGGIR
jgi:hypothetical protein